MDLHAIPFQDAKGAERTLGEFAGGPVLVVNTASECGFTPQYKGLQKLHERFAAKGLRVIAFPCNDFGEQEPGSDAEIQTFCRGRFGVKFEVFAKIPVKGEGKHPLYAHLIENAPEKGEVQWNFEKFLVGPRGEVVARFRSDVEPLDPALTGAVESLL